MSLNFPAQGRSYLMDAGVHGGTQVPAWYIALFEGDYDPQEDDTAANIGSRATEITAYSETTRPEFKESSATGGATSNSGGVATVTLTAQKSVSAFALVSSAGKGSSTGILLCYQRLPSTRTYGPGDVIKIPVSLVLANAV